MARCVFMSNKRRVRSTPSQSVAAGSETLSQDDAARMRQMMADAGAPEFILDAIQPGMSLAELMAEAQSKAPALGGSELLAELDEAMGPALRGKGDPFLAEAAVLDLLALIYAYVPVDEAFPDSAAFVAKVTELVGHAEQEAKPTALALLRTVAVHGPEQTRSAATEAGDRLVAGGLAELPFAEILGRPTPSECFAYGDMFGQQESIALTFAYGRKKHAVCVLIDYGLGGGLKDCWITDKATEIKKRYKSMGSKGLAVYEDLSLAEGLTRLQAALAADPCPEQVDQVRDTEAFLPLLRQRVALVAESVAATAV